MVSAGDVFLLRLFGSDLTDQQLKLNIIPLYMLEV